MDQRIDSRAPRTVQRSSLQLRPGGHFSDVNLSSVLFTQRLDDPKHVRLQVWSAPGRTKPSFEEAIKQKFKDAKKGDSFGPSCGGAHSKSRHLNSHLGTNHWWKVTVNIPADWEKYERVQFEFDPGCEAMIFTTDGNPVQAITGGYGGDRRVEYIIPPEARKAGVHEFVIESSCNGMFGVPWNGDTIAPPDMNRYFSLASADLVVPNQEAWRLLWDFQTLRQIVDTLPGNSALQNKALVAANQIMNVFKHDDAESIPRARKVAEAVFGEEWEKKGERVYEVGDEKEVKVWAIGHCHIDTAWLWPYSVTQQKVARSWATQLDLMDRYPEHRFCASSAQQYKWLEQLYPQLFERLKAKIASGQFHIIGGSWVENDANMPSGEALARQFIFGQRYFQSRFGKRCNTAWLPDSFGLTGALPQLIRGAGMDYFFTQKLSWNNINVFPHSTFNWIGLDGTQTLCHMTPVDTYTAQATVGDVRKATTNHKNLESTDTALLVFGNGDGGGGPLAPMLENLRRIRATANNSRDITPVSMGHTVEEFFEDLAKHTRQGATLPNWHGELYLEFHRGTYTSHGSIKKGKRKSEILLRDVEHVATLASMVKEDYLYPKKRIDDAWEKVLLNQFHDVLPGSAIGMVYEDAEKLYTEIAREGKSILEEAFGVLLEKSVHLNEPPKATSKGRLVAVNTVCAPRREVVQVPLGGPAASRLRSELVQVAKDGKSGYALMDASQGSGVAFATGMFADISPAAAGRYDGGFFLKNSNIEMKIEDGRIVSLVDLELGRELIPQGQTGGLVIFEDRPAYWDAWDTEIYSLETPTYLKFANIKVAETGPMRASLRAEVKIGSATSFSVTISLDAIPATLKKNSRSFVRFDAEVDWHQRHEFLKFEIPLNIKNDNATFETQFGFVSRPTHKNTTLDMAKFEVPGHKYADLSEYGYGVAILSESKYGFAASGNVLRISLLRAATGPDAEQDQGFHKFSWAVAPHLGHFLESDIPIAAYLFNSPLHLRHVPDSAAGGNVASLLRKAPFIVENAPNVHLETIKRGDDDTFSQNSKTARSIVLRLYEAYGGHARASLRITSQLQISKASLVNLLEEELEVLEKCTNKDESDEDTVLTIDFRGFQVVTVKLVLDSAKGMKRYKPSLMNHGILAQVFGEERCLGKNKDTDSDDGGYTCPEMHRPQRQHTPTVVQTIRRFCFKDSCSTPTHRRIGTLSLDAALESEAAGVLHHFFRREGRRIVRGGLAHPEGRRSRSRREYT
ncbi:glycoside hydrolase family 38 protein [Botryobasidium botryosum FD-172 SS1]|uniref:Alpha-mannosidase n=1 Tax=Botryobasidium botryosum (strain FD-172 SS1) TaxID=930990 RepID=A0A067M7T7_BOTB1|nr:glycoside hydrolase family 38 protein [Botryobasidium botryosum FD-172 SS1]